ncbi:hypothetical protein D3C71_1298930 [compost metagenome]
MSMKASTDDMVRPSTARSLMRTGLIACGCSIVTNSLRACLTSKIARIILIPPPVDPADVANPESSSMVSGANRGHWAKSVFA